MVVMLAYLGAISDPEFSTSMGMHYAAQISLYDYYSPTSATATATATVTAQPLILWSGYGSGYYERVVRSVPVPPQ